MSDSAGAIASTYSRPALGQGDVTRRAVEEANAKAVLETGNGIADCCRRHVQIEGRRTEACEPGDGDHSLELHQSTFVHYRDFPVMASQFISIIATIKVRYGAAILNDARRLECPKHLSLERNRPAGPRRSGRRLAVHDSSGGSNMTVGGW
jgi:hypothetical protein